MMKPEELRAKSGGVVAFPVTPFRDDLSLDIEGLRHNLSRLMNHPVCAVVAAGGTGEVYSLTQDEHAQVIETTVEIVNGNLLPLLPSASSKPANVCIISSTGNGALMYRSEYDSDTNRPGFHRPAASKSGWRVDLTKPFPNWRKGRL